MLSRLKKEFVWVFTVVKKGVIATGYEEEKMLY